MKKFFVYAMAALMSMSYASCSSDEDSSSSNQNSKDKYSDKSYGQKAMDDCATVGKELVNVTALITKTNLSAEQESDLYKVLNNEVNGVFIPTYTSLANEAEKLEGILNGLTAETITQEQVNNACAAFKEARKYWERSEAFLGGPASDFSVDPTIDSWPLNRTLLLNYFNNGMNEEMLDDATILGFHALEFILFRNGQPRDVAQLKGKDTYVNFENVTGEQELKYAQTICKLLKQRTFQLQVSWEGKTTANASRVAVVEGAGLAYTTSKGLSYGDNLILAGKDSKSTFSTLKDAIAQVLSLDEGSCYTIANEVGTAKIANPFATGDIAYVESPYIYNSITDFADNIRSIRNVWLGSTDEKVNENSFHTFFVSVNQTGVNTSVENAYNNAISSILAMPAPFVKYCSVIWGKNFDDPSNWKSNS